MNVVFLSPGYPAEMAEYTRGLAEVGARVLGVGDGHRGSLPGKARDALRAYLQVPAIMDEADVRRRVHAWLGELGVRPDRIEAQWEPLVLLAAQLREDFGIPGMSVNTVRGFRDKQLMKERVAAAGLRVPHSARVRTAAEVRAAAQRIGFPVILKPIAGAGSADTYRCDDAASLEAAIASMGHINEASCEEFVEGEEFTFDTVCIDGRPVWTNVAQYLPRPLVARTNEWISPIIVTVRDQQQAKLAAGIELGMGVLRALGMGTGFTHMEWYLKANGEVVFGEIGCRPGGAHLVDQMNFTADIDLFREWARAVCWRDFQGDTTRRYNCAIIFKRAIGQGRVRHIEGREALHAQYGPWICADTLLPPGTHRRDWTQTLVSDGFFIVRHPEWDAVLQIARDVASKVTMYAGD